MSPPLMSCRIIPVRVRFQVFVLVHTTFVLLVGNVKRAELAILCAAKTHAAAGAGVDFLSFAATVRPDSDGPSLSAHW
jgi:hypothetical protein